MSLFRHLLAATGARRRAVTSRTVPLAMERLDERIALAVDQFWVQPGSPLSTDNPTGAATNPFRSLEEAQTAIRVRLAARSQLRDIVVNIRGGTYDLDGPLVFSAADSGRNGRTVTWQAAPGETPVFSGSRPVTNWQLVVDPGLLGLGLNAVWKADVSDLSVAGRSELRARQLFIDGVRGTIAESNPTAMPGDVAPTYPYGFRPFIGQYEFLGTGEPVFGIAYSDPLDPNDTNPIDWRFPTTWDQVEGVSDPRRQRDVEGCQPPR